MRTLLLMFLLAGVHWAIGQTGHVMQGAGAVNFSLGGAATALPVDANGSIHWNPASITSFEKTELSVSAAFFGAEPSVMSSAMIPDGQGGFITVSGTTDDETGISVLPSAGVIFGNSDSRFTWGASASGISGFGVTYPMEENNPTNPNFDPTTSNPLLYPQNLMGFGMVFSEYQLMQIGIAGAYQLTDNLSVGLAPYLNFASLEIQPLPLAAPDMMKGYPISDQDWSTGVGFQIGLYYETDMGLNFGVAYKSAQAFSEFEWEPEYLDGSDAPTTTFTMDFPSIISVGVGYIGETFDIGLDYRYIDYENTEGFEKSGWAIADSGPAAGFPTGAVQGFGWESISTLSLGFQYRGLDKLPIRLGYTYSSNPLNEDNAFFSTPAPAIIQHAFQIGLGYRITDRIAINLTYHHGEGDEVSGPLLNPTPEAFGGPWNAETNPLGIVPNSEVTHDMTTDVYFLGLTFDL